MPREPEDGGRSLSGLRQSLSFKLCLFLGLAILGSIALFSFYFLYYEAKSLREGVREELVDLTGIVMRNTRRSMQSNHPEGIEDIIKTAGEQKNILSVRIYTRDGTVRYSSDPTSLGLRVAKDASFCKVCHAGDSSQIPVRVTDRIFEDDYRGAEALAIVAPIFGERGCYEAPCHRHPPDHSVLGILEIHRSLDDVQGAVGRSIRHALGFGLVLFGAVTTIALFFVLRFIHRPVSDLVRSAVRISHGDYGLQIPLHGRDELGQLTMVFNEMSQKISDRQRRLFESREEFRTLFNQVPAYILVLDPELIIKNANRTYTEDFGERTGQRCFETPLGQRRPCHDCPTVKTFEDGLVHSVEQVRTLPDGRERHFLIHSAPVRDEVGRTKAVMEIFTDITHVRELQKELVLLGETVAAISHTIKNILGGLEGGLYVVDAALRREDEKLLERGWEMVKGNVTRISRLVRDVLYLSRERTPVLKDTDPEAVCRDVVELLSPMAAGAGVALRFETSEAPKAIRVDPEGLHTVLVDLVTNAIEACRSAPEPSPHRVSLRYRHGEHGEATFEVEDDGPGVATEIQDLLLKKSVTTKGSKGTGLGLLVTKKIVDEHGGRIGFISATGQGTVFTVSFPIQSVPGHPQKSA